MSGSALCLFTKAAHGDSSGQRLQPLLKETMITPGHRLNDHSTECTVIQFHALPLTPARSGPVVGWTPARLLSSPAKGVGKVPASAGRLGAHLRWPLTGAHLNQRPTPTSIN
jgi:hypothetical protein